MVNLDSGDSVVSSLINFSRRQVSDLFGGHDPVRLQTLTNGLGMSSLARSFAKPRVAWVCSKPGMPDHQEVKRAQFRRRFHEPQGGIPFHHLPHAVSQREHRSLPRWAQNAAPLSACPILARPFVRDALRRGIQPVGIG